MTRYAQITPYEKSLSRLEAAQSRTDLQSVIESLRLDFGVDHLVYHWVNAKGSEMGVGTYSELWIERYKSQGHINIDPVILGCFRKFIR
ncbi:MAG: autoinducer binding domain-containing protein [Paracoccaceae bacterium]